MDIFESIIKVLDKYDIVIKGETYQNIVNNKVKEILENIFCQNKKIAIKGAGIHTESILKLVPNVEIQCIFDRSVTEECKKYILGKEYIIKPDKYIGEAETIIVSSFAHRKKMAAQIKEYDSKIKIIDLYDLLNQQGYCVNEPFYNIMSESYESFIYYRNEYEKSKTSDSLKSLIRSSVAICDFLNFEKYCQIYINSKFENIDTVKLAYIEIKDILEDVKQKIHSRKQEDIIMVWNDQVGYDDLDKTDFMKEMSENSLFFENAYTMTPFTFPVFKEMFQGLKSLDDDIYTSEYPKISSENSEFVKAVIDGGYEFCYIGDESDAGLFENQYAIGFSTYGSSCIRAFEMIQKLLDSDNPVFILLHPAVEVHNPYLSADLNEPIWYEWPYFQGDSQENVDNQMLISLKYWDRQLKYYMDYIGENSIKIIMSDHGKRFNTRPIYLSETTHVVLYVVGKNIPKIRCSELFSLYDFYKLVQMIINEDYDYSKICSDEVFLQETAIFNESTINYYIENNAIESSLAFRAVRTKNELYVLLSNGSRHYYRDGNEEDDLIDNKIYTDRIGYLNSLVDYKFSDLSSNLDMLQKFRNKYETHE